MSNLNKFLFSQQSLQDYLDCPRRFELRYLLHIDWPAEESHPMLEREGWFARGSAFHKLARGFLCGIPKATVMKSTSDPTLILWFDRLTDFLSTHQGAKFWWSEKTLNANLDGFIFTSVLDAVAAFENGEILIFDWKTSQKLPKKETIGARIQTLLYPIMLRNNIKQIKYDLAFPNSPLKIIYWFSEYPEQQYEFSFSPEQITENSRFIIDLVKIVSSTQPGDFHLTQDQKKCLFCVYRSLCDRGTKSGNMSELEDTARGENDSSSIRLSDIDEIEF